MKKGNSFIRGFALQAYLPAEDGLKQAQQFGYNHWYIDGSMHNEQPDFWPSERIHFLKKQVEKFLITPIFHGNFKVPLASDVDLLRQAAVDYVKKEIDICSQLNCPLIIHGGAIVEPRKIIPVKNLALNNLIKSIQELKKYAHGKGVSLWLENLSNYTEFKPFHYIACTTNEFEIILNKVNIKLFFDMGHANINAELPVEDFFNKFKDNIVGISMSNNDGHQDQHFKLQQGTLNYKNIIKIISESGWNGIIAFETRNALNPNSSIRTFLSYLDEPDNVIAI